MNWHERPVRMMRLDYIDELRRMKDADLDALARSKREDWHVNCEWVIGTPGVAPGLGHVTTFNTPKFDKYAALGDFDLVREYLPHARKYGIRVLAYLNMHWFSYDFAGQNPGWEQITADGAPYGRAEPPRLLVHLVNNTGDMQRPMSEIIPIRDVRIRLRTGSVTGIRARWAGRDLEFSATNYGTEFTVPEIGLYEVIVVDV